VGSEASQLVTKARGTAQWSIIVIARNEASRLTGCLDRIAREAAGVDACITVILNGCGDDSRQRVNHFASTINLPFAAYEIAFADKSNAWNQYIHVSAPVATHHLFVDGYAWIAPGSLTAFAEALDAADHAHAATGVPSAGRSAASQRRALRDQGGLHGSLHVLRGSFVERIRATDTYLPIGLYRGDGLIGSFCMHDLDTATPWDKSRVAVAEAATWGLPSPTIGDVPRFLRRRINQARGRMENAAIRAAIYPGGYAALPRYADDMILGHLAGAGAGAIPGDITARIAVRRLNPPRRPGLAETELRPLPVGQPVTREHRPR
jgi:hypothetical protein